jgi:hypothetical protein
MSEYVAAAIRALDLAEVKTGSRQGLRELDQARHKLQAQCCHRLTRDGVSLPYRYRCIDCDKYLKIRSGVLVG